MDKHQRALRRIARANDLELIKGKRHYQFRDASGRLVAVGSMSPSDNRTFLNLARDLKGATQNG